MSKKISSFYRQAIGNFLEAFINIILFLIYFFSISTLYKTLFWPWKRMEVKKGDWFNKISFNAISRVIGFVMRFSLIFFYFLLQSLLVLLSPIIFLIYLLIIPILFFENIFSESEEKKKELARLKFIGNHLLDQSNYQKVELWFEDYYQSNLVHKQWWKKNNLFSLPPLARDWSTGFTPSLDEYGEDLTNYVYQTNIKNIVDREKEIDLIERDLIKSNDANIVIVGDEGVGKHTIVDALAKKMYEGKTKSLLMYKRIVRLNMEKILTRENFFESLLQEASEAKNVIIFIDEIDKYISSDQKKVDLSISIEKFSKTNFLQFIGITTPFLFEKYFQTNERLFRLFNKIQVKEVTKEEAETILLKTYYILEKRYNLYLPYETIKDAITKSDFFITSIPFPEKAIELLDSACILSKQIGVKNNIVTPEYVDKVISEKTHIPSTITEETKDKLVHLEKLLLSQIFHQNDAINKLSSSLRRSFLLLGKRKKPLASFLFLGPTGVGKTETAKTISRIFFGSETYLVRLDMSLYQSKIDIKTLIGSIDTGNPGILSNAIRENPYGVLLLDEIEKADHDIINIFLTVFDEGYFVDGFGKNVDCKNLVVIATSNAGSDFIFKNNPSQENLINYLIENRIFSPEFLNRFDGVIAYNALNHNAVIEIAKRMIEEIENDVYKLYNVKFTVRDDFLNQIAQKGYDSKFGARNLERLIRDEIEDKIAKLVLENKTKKGEIITI